MANQNQAHILFFYSFQVASQYEVELENLQKLEKGGDTKTMLIDQQLGIIMDMSMSQYLAIQNFELAK